jgi:uncharacterized membrane protein YqjE
MSVDDRPKVMASETVSPSPGVLPGDTTRLINEFRQLVNDHLELATLETRLSVNTLVRMVMISIFTALVLVTAWLALIGSAAFGLVSIGVAPVLAMLLLAAANLLVAFIGWLWIGRLGHWLGWEATRRAIKPAQVDETKAGAA